MREWYEMVDLPGYYMLEKQIKEELWTLYKVYSIERNKVVGLKVNHFEDSELGFAETIHDYHMANRLSQYAVLQPIKLEKYGTDAYVITEPYIGITMREWLEQNIPRIDTFFTVSAKIIDILADIHQEQIIHKSLQPQNILIEPRTNELSITGFKHATTLTGEIQQPYVPSHYVETELLYWSPEQTGRMNHSLDYRTDLYSLGILFYEMLTGVVPFIADTGWEIIHAHLAKTPRPPYEINNMVPKQLSRIVMKLLEKTPGKRYQSTYGLKRDLERCMDQHYDNEGIEQFDLGRHDQISTLEKSHPLFGRNKEIQQLNDWYTQFKRGKRELLLISGASGTGKTVLAQELHQQIVQGNGYFISGKFAHVEENIPYAPFVQAFKSLFQELLSEGSESVERWKRILVTELAAYGEVIAAFIPEVTLFIGQQQKAITLPPKGLQNRFFRAIGIFVRIFAKEEHPLALFLDDLQWSDRATFELIDYLLHHSEIEYLSIIGAYRDDEVSVGHPLKLLIEKLSKEMLITEINVKLLEYTEVQAWIDEIFPMAADEAIVIHDFVHHFSQGNPLFIEQLLQLLYDERVVFFQNVAGKWTININRIHDLKVDGAMTNYISKRLKRLPTETWEIVQLASCFGNTFDLKQLAILANRDYIEIAEQLWHALEMGVILPLDRNYKLIYPDEDILLIDQQPPTYRFLHDHILRAIYMTLTIKERENNHLHIGNMLLERYGDNLEEHIFEIVNHLNLSRYDLIPDQKIALAKWNQMAGHRARVNMALDTSLTYFNIGKELLPHQCWEDPYYQVTIQLMMGLGEVEYLTKNFQKAEKTFDMIIEHARSFEDQINVFDLKVLLYTLTFQLEKALDMGLEGVRSFKWPINKQPKKWEVLKEYLLTKLALFTKKEKDLLNLPMVKEGNARLALRTLINTNASAYFVDQNLATVLMLKALRLTLKYGDMDVTALIYNNYALTLSAGFGDYEGSYHFGKLAIEHTQKYDDLRLKARVYFVFGSYINHWNHHMRHNIDYLEEAQRLGLESGNLHTVGASAAFISMILFIKGDNLKAVSTCVKQQIHHAKESEFALSDNYLEEILDWIDRLIYPEEQLDWTFPEGIDDNSSLFVHQTLRLQMTYLFQDESEAMKIMDHMESVINDKLIMIITPEYYFYYCLWTIKRMKNRTISIVEGKRKIYKKMKKMKKWAHYSPDNYKHQYLLLAAELESVRHTSRTATHLYQSAILLAEENGFLQDIAIANECVAHYYLAEELPRSAKGYMYDAYVYFLKWGAKTKAANLLSQYPTLIYIHDDMHHTSEKYSESLDLYTAFQVATVISGEINFQQLVLKIMEVLLTHGGGERACLVLSQKNKLRVVANYHINGETQIFQEWKDVDEAQLPRMVIDYVASGQSNLVLHNAYESGRFTRDRYIMKNKVQSILCLPILNQGKLIGILYLENNQLSHAFLKEQIDLLALLASQVAISIENTRLYDHLEAEVKDRTKLLNEVNENLMQANHQLAKSREEKQDFFANISHDLRSPIATIRSYIEAILDGTVDQPEQKKQYLQVVKNRLSSLNRLIEDLFELAQLELGNIRLSKEVLPLDRLFTHLCRQFEFEVLQENIEYVWELPKVRGGVYPLVEVDVARIEQVLTNLVSNAIKHAKGLIRISLSLEKRGQAIISVVDDGAGISAKEISYVFDRFYTKSPESKQQGYGLGLAICKEIMQYHDGEISIESEEGKRTIFSISLPMFSVT